MKEVKVSFSSMPDMDCPKCRKKTMFWDVRRKALVCEVCNSEKLISFGVNVSYKIHRLLEDKNE